MSDCRRARQRAFVSAQRRAMLAAITAPDFTRLDSAAAVRRVRELHCAGVSAPTIATLTGWSESDVCCVLEGRTS